MEGNSVLNLKNECKINRDQCCKGGTEDKDMESKAGIEYM